MKYRTWLVGLAIGCAADDPSSDTSAGADADTDADTDTDTDTDGIEIAGTYVDEWGSTHAIDDVAWTIQYAAYPADTFTFTAVHDDLDYAIAQNGADNAFSPDLYSRFDWIDDGADVWYCQSAFDAPDPASAEAASADPADLSGGCGTFAWTLLTP
jgi:hypothetical protein